MKFCSKEYMSKLFKFSNEVQGIEMRFIDENIEQQYFTSNCKDEDKKSLIFFISSILIYILGLCINLARSGFKSNRAVYIILGGVILEIVNFQISKKCLTNIKFFSIF